MKLPKFVKRFLWFLLVVLVLVVVMVALLPTLLSGRRAQSRLAAHVNASLPAGQAVSWDKMALGWTGVQRLENVVYREHGMQVTVESVTVERGLLGILGRSLNLGSLVVQSPRVEITLPMRMEEVDRPAPVALPVRPAGEPTAAQPASVVKDPVVGTVPRGVTKEPAQRLQMPMDIKGAITVRDGQLQVRSGRGAESMSWAGVQMHLDFKSGLQGQTKLAVSAQQDGIAQPGQFEGEGIFRLLQPGGTFVPEELQVDLAVSMQDVDASRMSWILHEQADAPLFHGVVGGQMGFIVRGMDDVSIIFRTHVVGPVLTDGPLGRDRLAPGDTSMAISGAWKDGTFKLEQATISNPVLLFSAAGRLGGDSGVPYPVGHLQVAFTADVARVMAQLPETLQTKEGLTLDYGLLTADLKLESDGRDMAVNLSAALPKLLGRQHDQVLALDHPVTMLLSGRLSPAGPVLEDMRIDAGFAHIQGKGTVDDFTAGLELDLDAALQTAAKFINLGERAYSGRISASVRLTKGDGETRVFQAGVQSQGIALQLEPARVLTLTPFTLETRGKLDMDASGGAATGVRDLRLVLQSDPVKLSLAVASIDVTTPLPAVTGGQLQWDVDLERVLSILASAGMTPADTRISGRFTGASGAELQGGKLEVAPFEAGIANLAIVVPGFELRKPSLAMRFSVTAVLPPEPLTIFLREGEITSEGFSLAVPELHISEDAGGRPLVSSQVALIMDMGAIAPAIRAATGTPLVLEGRSKTEFTWLGPLSPEWIVVVREGSGVGRSELDRVSAYGMHATNVVVTMQAEGGKMQLALDTAVNDGRVVVQPLVDVTGASPWLIVPDDARVIQDVTLTDEMASELLALVHPVFYGSSVLGGVVNLTLERCRVPMSEGGAQGADVQGRFLLKDLEIEPRGVLLDIMNMARLPARAVKVAEQEIAFRVENGRIHPSPLALTIDGHALVLTGSVGLDATLDYRAMIPVTADLVGREAFRLLEGATLALGIGGTVSRPALAGDAFAKAMASLVKAAAANVVREEGREAVRDLQERGEEALRDLLRKHRR